MAPIKDDKHQEYNDVEILEAAKCREIVQEIMNFGINQRQIFTLLKLLSLELEDNNAMKKITEAIDNSLETSQISNTTTILI